MRIDLLLKRENISRIFEKSFSKYLEKVLKVTPIVSWKDYSSHGRSLLVNDRLNVIYSKNIDRKALRSIVSEYAYHPNLIRHFLQKTYVLLASCTHFEYFFTKSRVEISPWMGELDNLCIVPGNHSIRIIDLQASICRVVLKDGFNAQFINNEIYLREKYNFLSLPKLLNFDAKGLWYEEEQVSALPLNRISDRNIKEKALLEAHRDLVNLYGLTLERVNANNYFKSLNKSCYDLVDRLPSVYDQEEKNRIKFVLRRLMANIDANSVYRVELVQSHGDFQPANILISNSSRQLYLIDWEYTAKRSVYYDALVFSTKCRSPKGLARRVEMVLHETDISWKWCVENANAKLSKLDLIVFLIEDLMVRLLEVQIPDMINKDSGLEIWSNEVKKMDWLTYG